MATTTLRRKKRSEWMTDGTNRLAKLLALVKGAMGEAKDWLEKHPSGCRCGACRGLHPDGEYIRSEIVGAIWAMEHTITTLECHSMDVQDLAASLAVRSLLDDQLVGG